PVVLHRLRLRGRHHFFGCLESNGRSIRRCRRWRRRLLRAGCRYCHNDGKDGSESCFGLRLHLFPPISACRLAPKVFRLGFSEQRTNCRARAARARTSFLWSHLAAASLSVMTADQNRDWGAAEIQRIAENAPTWPDVKYVKSRSAWLCSYPQHGRRAARHVLSCSGWRHIEGSANTPIQNFSGLPQKCRTQACSRTCAVKCSHLA